MSLKDGDPHPWRVNNGNFLRANSRNIDGAIYIFGKPSVVDSFGRLIEQTHITVPKKGA